MTIDQFLAQARLTFGDAVRRIDPAKSNMRPWLPMRFYEPPQRPWLANKGKTRKRR